MKRIALLVLTLFFSFVAFSQDVQYEDVVYLKNGSVIRGMIIEQIPNQTITIQTADRNLFVFEVEQIEKITKEEIPHMKTKGGPSPAACIGEQKGFEATLDLLFGIQLDWGEPVLGMHAIAGYRFFPQLFIGGGAGMEIYSEETYAPLFMQIRTDFIEGRISPFFAVNVGYAFGWVDGEDGSDWGGIFMEPCIGFRFNIAEHFGLNISSSFKFQRAYDGQRYYDASYPEGYVYERSSETYRLFTFKVGFSF